MWPFKTKEISQTFWWPEDEDAWQREQRAWKAELAEQLLPAAGARFPDLEATRINAEYWMNAAFAAPDHAEAVLFMEQAANAWKNAAYAMADQRDAARKKLDGGKQ